jgi:hypothetical protein
MEGKKTILNGVACLTAVLLNIAVYFTYRPKHVLDASVLLLSFY